MPRALVVLVLLASPLAVAHAQDVTAADSAALVQVQARIDVARHEAGVAPLRRDARLDAAAQAHSADMAAHDFLAHVSPRTGDPGTRVAAAGVHASSLAENVAMNQTVEAAEHALEGSADHHANIVARDVTHLGLGIARGPRGVYVTELFARIDVPAPPPPIAVAPPVPLAPPAPPVAAAPPAPPAPPQAQALPPVPSSPLGASPTTVAVDGSSRTGRRVVGYWVFGNGLWWYFPLPDDARPGQQLAPAPMPPGVAPPGYTPTNVPLTIPAPAVQARAVPMRPGRWRRRGF